MKRLSDYTGEEAFDLWVDIFDPAWEIINDEDVRKYTHGENADIKMAAKVVMKKHKEEALFILNRLDENAINGANAPVALTNLMIELIAGESSRNFFKSSEPERSDKKPSGSVMENTEDGVK